MRTEIKCSMSTWHKVSFALLLFLSNSKSLPSFFQEEQKDVQQKTAKLSETKSALDGKLVWSGSLTQTHTQNYYVALLNHQLPERTNWMRTALGLNLDYTSGKELFGHDAVLLHATIKHKGYWGAAAVKTSKESVLVGMALTGGHEHLNSKPPLWVESLWLDYSLDAVGTGNQAIKSEGLNRFRVGLFPFSLGRGIALGENYGVSQDFLASLIEDNDFYMPAFMFYGSLPNKRMNYKVYLARPQARSVSDGQVLALTKGHIIGQTGLPFAGDYQDDIIAASQLDLHLGNLSDNSYLVNVSPYGFYYHAPAKKVKLDPDSRMSLYTVGLASEFKINNFSFGFDTAFNRGSQFVEKIDTNQLVTKNNSSGHIVNQYTEITSTQEGKTPAVATSQMIQELSKNLHRDGKAFVVAGEEFISTPTRIRNSYTNRFKGYMGVVDAAYDFTKTKMSLAATAGYASGGKNPNKEQANEDYTGFLGINEAYSTARVPSFLMLGVSNLKRPLALGADSKGKLTDYIKCAFTDIMFAGTGFTWSPSIFVEYKPKVSTNVLGFWKDYAGKKIHVENANSLAVTVGTEDAANYLGTEINFACGIEIVKSLTLSVKAAIFFPGSYYKDIKGALLDDFNTKQLETMDFDQIRDFKGTYSIGNDMCYMLCFETKFVF